MKNISAQYKDLLEGKMSRDNFVRNCRQQFPQLVSPVTSVDDAIKILKSKRVIAESIQQKDLDANLPYDEGYEDNLNGLDLKDCPYDSGTSAAQSWKDGWMEYESQKQAKHDEETYRRETGGYGDLYDDDDEDKDDWSKMDKDDKHPGGWSGMTERLNEAEKTEGRWKEATGQGRYDTFKDIDNVNFTTFLRAVAFEVSKNPVINDDNLPAIMEKVAKAMKKDPMAYRDLVISNTADIAKQDETRKMREVKPGNMVDKDNGMKEVKGQEKYKADSAPKTEYKKGKPAGVKEMGVTPKKAAGIKDVMDMPGKEKVLDQLKESLKKSLKEDTHYKYSPGMEVQTPKGLGIVKGILGGTISVELVDSGEITDFQINVLDKAAEKAAFDKLPDLGTSGQNWLSSQIKQEDVKPKKDKYSKLKEYLKKMLKKEAVKFKAGGETMFTSNADAAAKEAELKKAGVKYTKSNA